MSSARWARSVFSSSPSSICIVAPDPASYATRSNASNFSVDTRSSFSGTPTNRRTSASACGVTPGSAHRVRELIGNAPHQNAVALGERKRQLPLLDRRFQLDAHFGGTGCGAGATWTGGASGVVVAGCVAGAGCERGGAGCGGETIRPGGTGWAPGTG